MENIKEIEVIDPILGAVTAYVIIDRGNGEFTSMSKAYWDEQQAQQTQGGLN